MDFRPLCVIVAVVGPALVSADVHIPNESYDYPPEFVCSSSKRNSTHYHWQRVGYSAKYRVLLYKGIHGAKEELVFPSVEEYSSVVLSPESDDTLVMLNRMSADESVVMHIKDTELPGHFSYEYGFVSIDMMEFDQGTCTTPGQAAE